MIILSEVLRRSVRRRFRIRMPEGLRLPTVLGNGLPTPKKTAAAPFR